MLAISCRAETHLCLHDNRESQPGRRVPKGSVEPPKKMPQINILLRESFLGLANHLYPCVSRLEKRFTKKLQP
jgi:hypothetical protein